MKYILDACALIAYFNDEEGATKLEQLLEQNENQFLLHSINLGEIYYDLLKRSKEKAPELFNVIEIMPITIIWSIDKQLLEYAGYFKSNNRISFADSFVLSLAKKENAIVISTDHHEFDIIEKNNELNFFWLR